MKTEQEIRIEMMATIAKADEKIAWIKVERDLALVNLLNSEWKEDVKTQEPNK